VLLAVGLLVAPHRQPDEGEDEGREHRRADQPGTAATVTAATAATGTIAKNDEVSTSIKRRDRTAAR
jgi:hypothetical protein